MTERPREDGILHYSRTADALDLWRAGERNVTRRPSGRILNFGDVEDAAYWRRAQQLIMAAAGGSREPGS